MLNRNDLCVFIQWNFRLKDCRHLYPRCAGLWQEAPGYWLPAWWALWLSWWPPAGCNNPLMYSLIFTRNFCYCFISCVSTTTTATVTATAAAVAAAATTTTTTTTITTTGKTSLKVNGVAGDKFITQNPAGQFCTKMPCPIGIFLYYGYPYACLFIGTFPCIV